MGHHGGGDVAVEVGVTLIWEWPRIVLTVLRSTPAASSKVAQLCRRSWKRIRGTPAARQSWWRTFETVRGWIAYPSAS